MSTKSPGFWFFTGDWMKDPELGFCSLFARGLLMDLLCLMFEAKERGYLSKPDGTPRSNEQIVDAVRGGSREEKLEALAELEASGVLSRDNRGVLFSRRMARLGEISQARSKAGSKGGSKTKAKPKQNDKQTDQQNTGVSVSDSVSDSELNTHTHTRGSADLIVPDEIAQEWALFEDHFLNVTSRKMGAPQAQAILMELGRRGWDKARRDLVFTMQKGGRTILDSDRDFEKSERGNTGTIKGSRSNRTMTLAEMLEASKLPPQGVAS